jgi:hypothetical protein
MRKNLSRLYIPVVLLGVLLLSAASCGGKPAQIGRAVIATEINSNNSPVGETQLNLLLTTPTIYLCAEVVNAKEDTAIDVEWRYLTEDRVLGTETFRGGRTDDRPQEFVTGVGPATSWLYSHITLTGLSWPVGSYEVTVKLDGREVNQVDFNVVGSQQFDELSKKALVESFYLGSKLNDQSQIAIPGSQFSRSQGEIYAVALLKGAPVATKVRAVWKYLEGGVTINDFLTTFSGSGYLPFDISLSRFGKLWPDRLWPAGTYGVSLYVDNVLVTTKNFTIS